MRRMLLCVLLVLGCANGAAAQTLVGDWRGTLRAGAVSLRLALHVKDADGKLTATFDSLDQGALGLPVSAVALTDGVVTFSLTAVGGSYTGKMSADGNTIDGTWSQNGGTAPLVLTRAEPGDAAAAAPKRPQEPTGPLPYREEEVKYRNATGGFDVAGTLTIPQGAGPFPTVLLLTGSGAQDRNETLMGHKPFLVLADALARRGIAVLRADDRGVGGSGGTFATATMRDFATDAEAGLVFLRTRSEVDQRRLGLIGHSEGGTVAPMVATTDPGVAFIVLLAGTGVPGDQILVAQTTAIAEAAGIPAAAVEANVAMLRTALELLKKEKDDAAFRAALRELLAGKVPDAQIDAQAQRLASPWFRDFATYDPAPTLARVKVPVLALIGEHDLQVSPSLNLPPIRTAVAAAGNPQSVVAEIPGVNHLFQTSKTGSPTEYGQIEETMSPAVLDRIASWILGLKVQ